MNHHDSGSNARLAAPLALALVLLAGCGSDDGSSPNSSAADVDVPSGTIAFRRFLDTEQTQAAVFTMSTDGSGEKQITKPPDGAVDQFPDWSPDGGRIAFQREFSDKPFEVYVINTDGSGEGVVDPGCPPDISSKEICEEFDPSWSPDGTSLAFSWAGGEIRQVRGQDTIEVLGIGVAGVDGSDAKLVTQRDRPTTSEDLDPTWSPDGKRIAFFRLNITAKPADGSAIFVANADGSSAKRITPWKLKAADITWSPDGELILFRSEPNPEQEHIGNLYTVKPDGTDLTPLTNTQGKEMRVVVLARQPMDRLRDDRCRRLSGPQHDAPRRVGPHTAHQDTGLGKRTGLEPTLTQRRSRGQSKSNHVLVGPARRLADPRGVGVTHDDSRDAFDSGADRHEERALVDLVRNVVVRSLGWPSRSRAVSPRSTRPQVTKDKS
jgi:Tol biopolymer transport system component